jgi:hypothetical protein
VEAIGWEAIDTELEGGIKEERRVEDEDRGDHGAKRGQSTTEEEGGDREEEEEEEEEEERYL